MRQAVKRAAECTAFALGEGSGLEKALLEKGWLQKTETGYQVFSREATGKAGQQVRAGDFVKLDVGGFPYPNSREVFLRNHEQTGNNTYIQKARRVQVWTVGETETEEVRFLINHKGLTIDPENLNACFRAPLWGTVLTAPRDAVLTFYSITRRKTGEIVDAEFNFVAREEFEKTYYFL